MEEFSVCLDSHKLRACLMGEFIEKTSALIYQNTIYREAADIVKKNTREITSVDCSLNIHVGPKPGGIYLRREDFERYPELKALAVSGELEKSIVSDLDSGTSDSSVRLKGAARHLSGEDFVPHGSQSRRPSVSDLQLEMETQNSEDPSLTVTLTSEELLARFQQNNNHDILEKLASTDGTGVCRTRDLFIDRSPIVRQSSADRLSHIMSGSVEMKRIPPDRNIWAYQDGLKPLSDCLFEVYHYEIMTIHFLVSIIRQDSFPIIHLAGLNDVSDATWMTVFSRAVFGCEVSHNHIRRFVNKFINGSPAESLCRTVMSTHLQHNFFLVWRGFYKCAEENNNDTQKRIRHFSLPVSFDMRLKIKLSQLAHDTEDATLRLMEVFSIESKSLIEKCIDDGYKAAIRIPAEDMRDSSSRLRAPIIRILNCCVEINRQAKDDLLIKKNAPAVSDDSHHFIQPVDLNRDTIREAMLTFSIRCNSETGMPSGGVQKQLRSISDLVRRTFGRDLNVALVDYLNAVGLKTSVWLEDNLLRFRDQVHSSDLPGTESLVECVDLIYKSIKSVEAAAMSIVSSVRSNSTFISKHPELVMYLSELSQIKDIHEVRHIVNRVTGVCTDILSCEMLGLTNTPEASKLRLEGIYNLYNRKKDRVSPDTRDLTVKPDHFFVLSRANLIKLQKALGLPQRFVDNYHIHNVHVNDDDLLDGNLNAEPEEFEEMLRKELENKDNRKDDLFVDIFREGPFKDLVLAMREMRKPVPPKDVNDSHCLILVEVSHRTRYDHAKAEGDKMKYRNILTLCKNFMDTRVISIQLNSTVITTGMGLINPHATVPKQIADLYKGINAMDGLFHASSEQLRVVQSREEKVRTSNLLHSNDRIRPQAAEEHIRKFANVAHDTRPDGGEEVIYLDSERVLRAVIDYTADAGLDPMIANMSEERFTDFIGQTFADIRHKYPASNLTNIKDLLDSAEGQMGSSKKSWDLLNPLTRNDEKDGNTVAGEFLEGWRSKVQPAEVTVAKLIAEEMEKKILDGENSGNKEETPRSDQVSWRVRKSLLSRFTRSLDRCCFNRGFLNSILSKRDKKIERKTLSEVNEIFSLVNREADVIRRRKESRVIDSKSEITLSLMLLLQRSKIGVVSTQDAQVNQVLRSRETINRYSNQNKQKNNLLKNLISWGCLSEDVFVTLISGLKTVTLRKDALSSLRLIRNLLGLDAVKPHEMDQLVRGLMEASPLEEAPVGMRKDMYTYVVTEADVIIKLSRMVASLAGKTYRGPQMTVDFLSRYCKTLVERDLEHDPDIDYLKNLLRDVIRDASTKTCLQSEPDVCKVDRAVGDDYLGRVVNCKCSFGGVEDYWTNLTEKTPDAPNTVKPSAGLSTKWRLTGALALLLIKLENLAVDELSDLIPNQQEHELIKETFGMGRDPEEIAMERLKSKVLTTETRERDHGELNVWIKNFKGFIDYGSDLISSTSLMDRFTESFKDDCTEAVRGIMQGIPDTLPTTVATTIMEILCELNLIQPYLLCHYLAKVVVSNKPTGSPYYTSLNVFGSVMMVVRVPAKNHDPYQYFVFDKAQPLAGDKGAFTEVAALPYVNIVPFIVFEASHEMIRRLPELATNTRMRSDFKENMLRPEVKCQAREWVISLESKIPEAVWNGSPADIHRTLHSVRPNLTAQNPLEMCKVLFFLCKISFVALAENDASHNTTLQNYRYPLGQSMSKIYSARKMGEKMYEHSRSPACQLHATIIVACSVSALYQTESIRDDFTNSFFKNGVYTDPLTMLPVKSETDYMKAMYGVHFYTRGIKDPVKSTEEVFRAYHKITMGHKAKMMTSLHKAKCCLYNLSPSEEEMQWSNGRISKDNRISLSRSCDDCRPHIAEFVRLFQMPILKFDNEAQLFSFMKESLEKFALREEHGTYGDPYIQCLLGKFCADRISDDDRKKLQSESIKALSRTELTSSAHVIQSNSTTYMPMMEQSFVSMRILKSATGIKNADKSTMPSDLSRIESALKSIGTDEVNVDDHKAVQAIVAARKDMRERFSAANFESANKPILDMTSLIGEDQCYIASIMGKFFKTQKNRGPDCLKEEVVRPYGDQGSFLARYGMNNFEKYTPEPVPDKVTEEELKTYSEILHRKLKAGKLSKSGKITDLVSGHKIRKAKERREEHRAKRMQDPGVVTERKNLRAKARSEISRLAIGSTSDLELEGLNHIAQSDKNEVEEMNILMNHLRDKLENGDTYEDACLSVGDAFAELCNTENVIRDTKLPVETEDGKHYYFESAEKVFSRSNTAAANEACQRYLNLGENLVTTINKRKTEGEDQRLTMLQNKTMGEMNRLCHSIIREFNYELGTEFVRSVIESDRLPIGELYPKTFVFCDHFSSTQQVYNLVFPDMSASQRVAQLMFTYGNSLEQIIVKKMSLTLAAEVKNKLSLISFSPNTFATRGYSLGCVIQLQSVLNLDYSHLKANILLKSGVKKQSSSTIHIRSGRVAFVMAEDLFISGQGSLWASCIASLNDPLCELVNKIADKLQFGGARDLMVQDERTKELTGLCERIVKPLLKRSANDMLENPASKKKIMRECQDRFREREKQSVMGEEPLIRGVSSSDETKWGPTLSSLAFYNIIQSRVDITPDLLPVFTNVCMLMFSKIIHVPQMLIQKCHSIIINAGFTIEPVRHGHTVARDKYMVVDGMASPVPVKDIQRRLNIDRYTLYIITECVLTGDSVIRTSSHMGQGVMNSGSSAAGDAASTYVTSVFEQSKRRKIDGFKRKMGLSSTMAEKRSSDDSITVFTHSPGDKESSEMGWLMYEMIVWLQYACNIRKSTKHIASPDAIFAEVYSHFTANNPMIPVIKELIAVIAHSPGSTPQQNYLQNHNLIASCLEQGATLAEVNLSMICGRLRNNMISPKTSLLYKTNALPLSCYGASPPVRHSAMIIDPMAKDNSIIEAHLESAIDKIRRYKDKENGITLTLEECLSCGLEPGDVNEFSMFGEGNMPIKNTSVYRNPVVIPLMREQVEKVAKIKSMIRETYPEIQDVSEELASLAFRRAQPRTQLASAFKMMQSVNAQDPNAAAALNPVQSLRNFVHSQNGSFVSVGKYVDAPCIITDSGKYLTSFNRFSQWKPVPISKMTDDLRVLEIKLKYCRENKIPISGFEQSFLRSESMSRSEIARRDVTANYEIGDLHVERSSTGIPFDTGQLTCALIDPKLFASSGFTMNEDEIAGNLDWLQRYKGLVLTTLLLCISITKLILYPRMTMKSKAVGMIKTYEQIEKKIMGAGGDAIKVIESYNVMLHDHGKIKSQMRNLLNVFKSSVEGVPVDDDNQFFYARNDQLEMNLRSVFKWLLSIIRFSDNTNNVSRETVIPIVYTDYRMSNREQIVSALLRFNSVPGVELSINVEEEAVVPVMIEQNLLEMGDKRRLKCLITVASYISERRTKEKLMSLIKKQLFRISNSGTGDRGFRERCRTIWNQASKSGMGELRTVNSAKISTTKIKNGRAVLVAPSMSTGGYSGGSLLLSIEDTNQTLLTTCSGDRLSQYLKAAARALETDIHSVFNRLQAPESVNGKVQQTKGYSVCYIREEEVITVRPGDSTPNNLNYRLVPKSSDGDSRLSETHDTLDIFDSRIRVYKNRMSISVIQIKDTPRVLLSNKTLEEEVGRGERDLRTEESVIYGSGSIEPEVIFGILQECGVNDLDDVSSMVLRSRLHYEGATDEVKEMYIRTTEPTEAFDRIASHDVLTMFQDKTGEVSIQVDRQGGKDRNFMGRIIQGLTACTRRESMDQSIVPHYLLASSVNTAKTTDIFRTAWKSLERAITELGSLIEDDSKLEFKGPQLSAHFSRPIEMGDCMVMRKSYKQSVRDVDATVKRHKWKVPVNVSEMEQLFPTIVRDNLTPKRFHMENSGSSTLFTFTNFSIPDQYIIMSSFIYARTNAAALFSQNASLSIRVFKFLLGRTETMPPEIFKIQTSPPDLDDDWMDGHEEDPQEEDDVPTDWNEMYDMDSVLC